MQTKTVLGFTSIAYVLIFLVTITVLYFKFYLPAKNKTCPVIPATPVEKNNVAVNEEGKQFTVSKNSDGSYAISGRGSSSNIFKDAKGNIYIGSYQTKGTDGKMSVTTDPAQKTFVNFRGLILLKTGALYKQYIYDGKIDHPSKLLDDAVAAGEAQFAFRKFYTGKGISVCEDGSTTTVCLIRDDGTFKYENSIFEQNVSGLSVTVYDSAAAVAFPSHIAIFLMNDWYIW